MIPPNPSWPDQKVLALNFVLNYEEGAENSLLNGDLHSEVFLNETPGSAPRPVRDMNMESQYEYGTRCGVWRILRLFDRFQMPFTCYAVGKAVELNPAPIQEMFARGHEIASHNYRWVDYNLVDEKTTAEHVHLAINSIVAATGQPPCGFYTGRIGPQTRRIVAQVFASRNLNLLYDSDAYNDDLPYWTSINGNGHLVIPYTLDQNDMKFSVPPGFTSANAYFEYLRDSFDVLYQEGRQGNPKFMSVGLHCRLVGKPGRIKALERFLEHVNSFPDVWVCTRKQVAEHWRSTFPYTE